MGRFVFYNQQSLDTKTLMAAKKTATSLGVKVLRVLAGTMLLEASTATAAEVAKSLPGWRYAAETKYRLPERERQRPATGKA